MSGHRFFLFAVDICFQIGLNEKLSRRTVPQSFTITGYQNIYDNRKLKNRTVGMKHSAVFLIFKQIISLPQAVIWFFYKALHHHTYKTVTIMKIVEQQIAMQMVLTQAPFVQTK